MSCDRPTGTSRSACGRPTSPGMPGTGTTTPAASASSTRDGWTSPPTSPRPCTRSPRSSRRGSAGDTASPGTARTSSGTTRCRAPTTPIRGCTGTGSATCAWSKPCEPRIVRVRPVEEVVCARTRSDDGRSRIALREAELTDPWVALEPGADAAEHVRLLRRAYETFTEAGTVQRPVRPVVADSWRRSARAGVGPDGTASVELSDGDLGSYRAEHPLARVMPLFRELMGTFAADGEHLLAVCDTHGRLLWVEGHPTTRRQADRMNFVPGARWAETAMGTNAPGTAVAVDRPVQVFAAEHFIRRVQPWTCAAAPVHDPRSGRVLGAVDVTGGDGLAHPHSLGFVQAVARAAESQLALLTPVRQATDGALLSALGRDEAELRLDGHRIRLSRRHSEIL